MAVTDLTGYTYVINDTIPGSGLSDTTFNLNFTCNNQNYTTLYIDQDYNGLNGSITIIYGSTTVYEYEVNDGDVVVGTEWNNQSYRTITITGGTDATNSDLIAWLEANGTLTAPASSQTNNLFFGNSKATYYLGALPVASMWYGTTKVYEEGGSSTTYYSIDWSETNCSVSGPTQVEENTTATYTITSNENCSYLGAASYDGSILTLNIPDISSGTYTTPAITSSQYYYFIMFPIYKIKFNNNNTYLVQNTSNISNDITVLSDIGGLSQVQYITVNGYNIKPSNTKNLAITITTTNYFYDLSDITVSGFDFMGKIAISYGVANASTNQSWFSSDLKTITLVLQNSAGDALVAKNSTPSLSVTSHSTLPDFKNKEFTYADVSWGLTSMPWITQSSSQNYVPNGLGFTSNGTHFKGFGYTPAEGGKGASTSYSYINDNDEKVSVATQASGSVSWVDANYKTIKFDNVNYTNTELWYFIVCVMGATIV